MVVFSNRQLGPGAELLLCEHVARTMLRDTAAAARPVAAARWELELAVWLACRAELDGPSFDVCEIAWTPDHLEVQRRFVVEAIQRAARSGQHALAFDRWRRLIEAHPAAAVRVGTRWQWPPGGALPPELPANPSQ